MLNDPGARYIFAFRGLRGRAAAAKLAYKAERSAGCDRKQAGKAAFKAFMVQSVVIKGRVINLTSSSRLRQSIHDLSNRPFARTITTLDGSDPIAKRGSAQNLDRVIIFRSWAYKDMSHPGHAALAIKSKTSRNLMDSTSKEFTSEPNLPFSWMPDDSDTQKGRPLKMRLLRRKYATTDSPYEDDKEIMTSQITNVRLMAGHGAIKKVMDTYDLTRQQLIQTELKAITTPRPRQKRIKGTNDWVTSADKVYIPAFGKAEDKKTGIASVHMFGLSEKKMRLYIHEMNQKIETGEVYYQKNHPKNNCSAKALEVAKVGGLDHYIDVHDYWIWIDPSTFHTVAVRLQKRIDELNGKVEAFNGFAATITDRPDRETYWHRLTHAMDKKKPNIQTSMEKPFKRMSLIETTAYLKHYLTEIQKPGHSEFDPKIRSSLSLILKKLASIEKQNGDLDKIVPHSIALVEEIDRLKGFIKSEAHKRNIFLPVNQALQHIRNLYNVDPLA